MRLRLLLMLTIVGMVPIGVWLRPLNMNLGGNQGAAGAPTKADLETTTQSEEEKLKMTVLILGITAGCIGGVLLLCLICGGICFYFRSKIREFEEIERMQKMADKKETRERLQFEKLTFEKQRYRRDVIADMQRQAMLEGTNEWDEELMKAATADGHVKAADFNTEYDKIMKAVKSKTEVDQRAITIRALAGIAECDAAAKEEDLVEVSSENCLHPEIKARKFKQLITQGSTTVITDEKRPYHMNSVVLLDKTKAYIGQLPPNEKDLFNIVIFGKIAVIVVDGSLTDTYIWQKYFDMGKDQAIEVGADRIFCINVKKMLKTGFVARQIVYWQGKWSVKLVLIFVQQIHRPNACVKLLELEDVLGHIGGAPSERAAEGAHTNLLFLDSTGTNNAVTLCGLYICRQQLMLKDSVNIPFVIKHISRSRYGCWNTKTTLEVAKTMAAMYYVLGVTKDSMESGEDWRKKAEQKSQRESIKSNKSTRASGSQKADGSRKSEPKKESVGGKGGSSTKEAKLSTGKSEAKKVSSLKSPGGFLIGDGGSPKESKSSTGKSEPKKAIAVAKISKK